MFRRCVVLVAIAVMAVGLMISGGATAATPHPVAGSKSVMAKSSVAPRLGTGGVRQSGRLDGSGKVPAMRPVPKNRSAGSPVRPAGNPRQGTWYYGPITIQPGYWSDSYLHCPAGMLATGGGE